MSTGDERRERHDVEGALVDYLARIEAGGAGWHDYHMAGVLTSRQAETVWLIGGEGWRERYVELIANALHLLDMARAMAIDDTVAVAGIDCDRGLTLARRTRLEESRSQMIDDYLQAVDLLESVVDLLRPLGSAPNVLHQLAICCDFLTRLAWGRNLGLGPRRAVLPRVRFWTSFAMRLFRAEASTTPDRERAYRSFLFNLAIGHAVDGKLRYQFKYAWLAGLSAARHGDLRHTVRAMAIMGLGRTGERLLLQRRGA